MADGAFARFKWRTAGHRALLIYLKLRWVRLALAREKPGRVPACRYWRGQKEDRT